VILLGQLITPAWLLHTASGPWRGLSCPGAGGLAVKVDSVISGPSKRQRHLVKRARFLGRRHLRGAACFANGISSGEPPRNVLLRGSPLFAAAKGEPETPICGSPRREPGLTCRSPRAN
jgi:hypothetical protein